MKAHLENALRNGIIFGIVTVFVILIGFNIITAQLIAGLLGNTSGSGIGNLTPTMLDMLIFFGLIALWAGSRGARKVETDTWGLALLSSALSGAVCGLMVAILVYIIGSLAAEDANITRYLAQFTPDAVSQLMLGSSSPLNIAILYLVFFTIAGILGGVLARGIGRGAFHETLSGIIRRGRTGLNNLAIVKTIRSNRWARIALYTLLILIAVTIPLWIGPYWNYTIGTVGIYVLLGLGLNIVVGLAGLLDLGYVAFFAIGAYSVALLTAPAPHNLLWSFWLALPIGVLLAALAGVLLGVPVLRMRGDYLAIVTLGFGEIIRILSGSDLLLNFSGGPKGVPGVGSPTLFGLPFNSDIDFVFLIILAVLLIIFVTTRLQHSRVGRAWVAMREDETVARAMGINTLSYKLLAFSIGAAFAGLGGVIFASRNQFTGPDDFTLMVSINVLCVVIVGGMGSIPGVIAGAFVLKGLPEILRELENYRVLAFGALLMIMMIMRPEGLIPSRRRQMEMHEESQMEPPQPIHPASTAVGEPKVVAGPIANETTGIDPIDSGTTAGK